MPRAVPPRSRAVDLPSGPPDIGLCADLPRRNPDPRCRSAQADGFRVRPPVCIWIMRGYRQTEGREAAEYGTTAFLEVARSLQVTLACVVAGGTQRNPLPTWLDSTFYYLQDRSAVASELPDLLRRQLDQGRSWSPAQGSNPRRSFLLRRGHLRPAHGLTRSSRGAHVKSQSIKHEGSTRRQQTQRTELPDQTPRLSPTGASGRASVAQTQPSPRQVDVRPDWRRCGLPIDEF